MPLVSESPEGWAPTFARSRQYTSARTYWKCEIGRRIHLAREKARRRVPGGDPSFTREGFARAIDISPRRLWEIENGLLAVDGADVALIAQALDVHPGALFEDPDWAGSPAGHDKARPAWLIARTIEDLPEADRCLVEGLAMRLSASQGHTE